MKYDLSKVPFEVLKSEYEHRLLIRKKQRKQEKLAAANCENCAHRIMWRPFVGGNFTHETWVCEMKPKLNRRHYTGRMPEYAQAYRVCNHKVGHNCEMFINRLSQEGKRIIEKRSSMSDRVSDLDI